MAEVYGSIGNEYVELNNAATEATLKQLLQAVQKQGGTGAAGAVGSTAGAAGVNTASIEAAKAAAKAQNELAEKANTLKKAYVDLAIGLDNLGGKLLKGTSNSSDLFEAFEKLPYGIGVVASAFKRVAQFQEENLGAYQKITDAGVSFGGSLTDMRTAAANTYMTLDQFANLMKRNNETLSRMGGTADQGAKAFTILSNSLLKSEAGTELRALGYTTDQVNQGMLTYIAATGGRTKEELRNSSQITKSTVDYLSQLDALATITGKTREEQEAQMKERAANEAWQAHLLTLGIEERNRAEAAANEARVRGGKGAEQALMSAAMGFPPMTKEAQQFTSITRNANDATMKLVSGIKDSSKTVADIQRDGAAVTAGLAKDGKENSQLFKALVMQGGEQAQISANALGAANKAQVQGIKTADDAKKQLDDVRAEQEKRRKESEAKAAVEAQKAMQEMTQALLSILMPAIKLLTAVINPLAKFVSAVMTQFEKLGTTLQLITVAGLAFLAFKKLELARATAGQIPTGGSGGAGGIGGSGIGKGLGGRLAGSLKGGLGGIAGGLALGAAADYAASNGMEKTGAGLDIASTAAQFAGTGAMLGSIVPGAGTALGAGLGAAAGGAYGLYQNWGKLFGDSGQKKMADGALVSRPTNALVGEAGPEIVAPTRHFENLQNELQTLNKQTAEMLRYLKETAESTRNSNDSIKNLGGDLFKF